MPAYYQHDDRLDVSYSSRAPSLDRARNKEMTQQGVSMSDTNAMMQVQQQQVPYLPPNYPGLPMVNYWQAQRYLGQRNSRCRNFQLCNSSRAGAILLPISGPARCTNAASDANSFDP
uniref:Uncharacterized protein n=1 Tax=Romanomermis culicivorax TaxID=13658 RepID=A0A915K4E8_ROMCU